MSLRAELVKSVPKVCFGFREDITSSHQNSLGPVLCCEPSNSLKEINQINVPVRIQTNSVDLDLVPAFICVYVCMSDAPCYKCVLCVLVTSIFLATVFCLCSPK